MARVLANTSRLEPSDLDLAADHLQYAVAIEPNVSRLVERDPDMQAVLDLPRVQPVLQAAEALLNARGNQPKKTAEDLN